MWLSKDKPHLLNYTNSQQKKITDVNKYEKRERYK